MKPLAVLFLLFVTVPLAEIYVLIRVGSVIGAVSTIVLCIGTAMAGATLLRAQGLSTLARVQQTLDRGEVPAVEMLEGALLLVSGLFLLTPGFVTDVLGFACLVPPLRRALVLRWLERRVVVHVGGRPPGAPGSDVIDGEYERVDPEKLR